MTSSQTHDDSAASRRLVGALIASASLEVIPLKGAESAVRSAPAGTTVTITCSPRFGLERTLDHVAAAAASGYRVVPHLAARMVEDEQALRRFVSRVVDLGADDLYVIGGDADEPLGRFGAAEQILDSLQDFDHGLTRIGVGCYPEGHPKISDSALMAALMAKQVHADYMVSQLCFDSAALVRWLDDVRAGGVRLPLRIGLAAPIRTAKLVELSIKIGVGQSIRYLTKQHGMVGGLLLGRSYAPEKLLLDMGERLGSPDLDVEGLHVFTFNQVEVTVGWQRRVAEAGV
jgi:methylenetetrahydrofolate reductase (NADPH)